MSAAAASEQAIQTMTFQWPWLLLFLVAIPLFAVAYWWILRRQKPAAVRFSSLSLLADVLPKHNRYRRHIPFALFLLGLSSIVLAMARPAAAVQVPLSETSIILALDVSLSMCATDIEPNRFTIAKEAAQAFIADQPAGTRIGIVAFAGFAEIVVPPTTDRELLSTAVDNMTASLGTAIGSATLKSIDAIAEINSAVAPSGVDLSDADDGVTEDESYQPDIIVLLTDGANGQGVTPIAAAQVAADRGVRVYTIGFGTTNPTELACEREQLGVEVFEQFGSGFTGSFGGNGFAGFGGNIRQYLVIDEPTLQAVADETGGDYFRAQSAEQLVDVFLNLPSNFTLQTQFTEVSVVFAALGALLIGASFVLSQMWSPLP